MPNMLAVDVSPTETTTYTLTVTNSSGDIATATATIIVNSPTTTTISSEVTTTTVPTTTTSSSVPVTPPSITYFFSGTGSINAGETTYLWASYSGTSASVDNGIGSFPNALSVNVSPTVTTTYTLTVSNGAGDISTAVTTIYVNTPTTTTVSPTTSTTTSTTSTTSTTVPLGSNSVTITNQPTSNSVLLGNTNTFGVTATGAGSLSYQWLLDDVEISGATSRTYVASEIGSYTVRVTSSLNGSDQSVLSQAATLGFTSVTITSDPISGYVSAGQSRWVSAGLSIPNGLSVSYQWFRDGSAISGGTTQSYFANVSGEYSLQITSARNGKTDVKHTGSATITVVPLPTISQFNASSLTIANGSSTTLAVTFDGGTGVVNPGNVSVTSGDQIVVSPTTTTNYTLSVTNAAGSSTGRVLTITVTTGSFTDVSTAMSVNRFSGSSSITLMSGKVLVLGSPNQSVKTDLYDPVTNKFTRTGDLNVGRADAKVVRLQDGRVMAIGGRINTANSNDATNSVEIFDPTTGQWSSVANMNTARKEHFAVLLNNGKVLVGGGTTDSGAHVLTSELYDPSTNSWTATGNLPNERYAMGASVLPNGNVIILGGRGYESATWKYLNSAAEYDVTTATWSSISSTMNVPHGPYSVTVTLNDGRVLIAGGYIAGLEATTAIDIYDPVTKTFASANTVPHLTEMRAEFTGHVLQDGKVVFIGGLDGLGNSSSTVDVLDPETNRVIQQTRNMFHERHLQSSALLADGRILIVGGNYSAGDTGEVFNE